MILRSINLQKGYLHFPVKLEGSRNTLQIWHENVMIREFYLAITAEDDFEYFFLDMKPYIGKTLTLILPDPYEVSENVLSGIINGDGCDTKNPMYPNLYKETLRPQYHFSSKSGWLNDPNGLLYADGIYHMYYQHNPLGVRNGNVNVSWGHAVSTDLIYWEEKSDAILPWRRDWFIASGSALLDTDNAAGYGKNAIIAAFTALGTYDDRINKGCPSGGQFMAASIDGGDTFYLFSQFPVVPTENGEGWRDPRIFRYDDHYVMAVYETENNKNCVSFYTSTDLHNWERASRNPDLYECPDIFPLETEDKDLKWVLFGADGMARIGSFDGYSFKESGISHPLDYGNASYAGQTWNSHPQNKRVHISWVRGMGGVGEDLGYENMPFSQCMTIPCELKLKRIGESYQVLRYPIDEAIILRNDSSEEAEIVMDKPKVFIPVIQQSEYEFNITDIIQSLDFHVGIHAIRYISNNNTLVFENGQQYKLQSNQIKIKVMIDTTTVELFFEDGIAATYAMYPDQFSLAFSSNQQNLRITYKRWSLKSIWA